MSSHAADLLDHPVFQVWFRREAGSEETSALPERRSRRRWSRSSLVDLCISSRTRANSKRAEAKLKDVGGKLEEKKVEVRSPAPTLSLTLTSGADPRSELTLSGRRPYTQIVNLQGQYQQQMQAAGGSGGAKVPPGVVAA